MLDLVLLAITFCAGTAYGALWREIWRRLEGNPPQNETHGMYGHPHLSRWFIKRDQEASEYWRQMPLRQYIKAKGGKL